MLTICRTAQLDETAMLDAFLADGCLVPNTDGSLWIAWGDAHRALQPESGSFSLYAPDFFLKEEHPWRIYPCWSRVRAEELLERLEPLAAFSRRPDWHPADFASFAESFEDIQTRIANGSLRKAVPFITRSAHLNLDPAQRASLLVSALRRCQGEPLYPYGFWDSKEGMIGTTPETLFLETPRDFAVPKLLTMALAGTRRPGAGCLLDDPKELAEHRIVVEGIIEQLSPFGNVLAGETRELELPTLVHLYTPIEVHPNRPVAFEEWVSALHPTAAIGAWPKAEGWRWLRSQPNAAERSRFGAPFGFVSPETGTGACFVAIRNVQWSESQVTLTAGGGIVAASKVDREWNEFNAKLDSIQGALGL